MNDFVKKAGLGVALAATALTTAVPADAQRYRHYRHGDGAGTAIVAGIAGLAIGAAIASNGRDRDRYYRERGYDPYYDDGYYRSHGYYPNDGYYAYRYRPNYQRCWIERRYDRYYGYPVRVRVCN
ncbi:MAG: hypothetical protein P0Y59_23045 [Candidatus Sphingomonas phytovorans]|nr:hypothetical protein [Sphingomonas sp.]WEJ99746.1 MAG: hypothetical protein P0Y59_23045 [Sphingomonas sp.]